MNFCVKSRTSVITNSSSEVFTYVDQDSIDSIKRLVNSVLSATGSPKTCDDLVKIEFGTNRDLETVKQDMKWEKDLDHDPTDQEAWEYLEADQKSCLEYREGHPPFDHLRVTPLVPEAEELCKTIENLVTEVVKNEEFYC